MTRDRLTWLAYLMLAFYSYLLNIFGPITPYLKSELHLSYTVSSLHFSAFALGMIAAGLLSHRLIRRTGRWTALWIAAFGISLGALLLIAGRTPLLTIAASFVMGLVGSLILTVVPSVLADRHGELRSVAFSEANVIASVFSAIAPVLVGWFAATVLGWRAAVAIGALAAMAMWFLFRGLKLPAVKDLAESDGTPRSLPAVYWVYWTSIVAVVSVEFCMIFWSASYLETGLGMPKAGAAQAVSLFLAGMILGRAASSRLAARAGVHNFVTASLLTAAVGFLIYWSASAPWLAMAGLFITGMGVASLYPLTLSLAIGSAGGGTVQASAFSSLASGVAILLLPLILGRLADAVGIHQAYILVLVLLVMALLLIQATLRLSSLKERIQPQLP